MALSKNTARTTSARVKGVAGKTAGTVQGTLMDENRGLPSGVGATPVTAIKNARDRKELAQGCAEIRELNENIAIMEARKKEVMEATIRPLVTRLGHDKIKGDGWLLLKSQQTRKTIRADKLVALGVDVDVIEQATEVKVTDVVSIRKATEE